MDFPGKVRSGIYPTFSTPLWTWKSKFTDTKFHSSNKWPFFPSISFHYLLNCSCSWLRGIVFRFLGYQAFPSKNPNRTQKYTSICSMRLERNIFCIQNRVNSQKNHPWEIFEASYSKLNVFRSHLCDVPIGTSHLSNYFSRKHNHNSHTKFMHEGLPSITLDSLVFFSSIFSETERWWQEVD